MRRGIGPFFIGHRPYRPDHYGEGLLTQEVGTPFFVGVREQNGAKSQFQWPQTQVFENLFELFLTENRNFCIFASYT